MTPRSIALSIAGSVFVLDRLTKLWIERNVSAWDVHHIIPGFFDIIHTKNPGAAFGMFAESEGAVRTVLLIGVSLAVLLFLSFLLLRPGRGGGFTGTKITLVGLSLVMGGAAGNIYDRAVHGMVTDFLEFYFRDYRFAAFNIADSAITCGAALLLIDMWRTRNQSDAPQAN